MTIRTVSGGLACVLGTCLAVLAMAASAQGQSSATSATTASQSRPAQTNVAFIRLGGQVLESPPDFSLFDDASAYMTLSDWLQRLAKARADPAVAAVALEIDNPQINWAQAQELADAVKRLNQVKPVHAFLNEPSAVEYLVACNASHVAMEGAAELDIVGLAAEMVFFRGTLDKLGIKPQMIQVGKFKGASEPFMNTKPSGEVVEMYNWVLDDLYDQLCAQIADGRRLGRDKVRQAIDEGPLSAASAVKSGLVDKVIERIDWRDSVARGVSPGGEVNWLDGYGRKPRPSLDLSNPFSLLSLLIKGKPTEQPRDPTIAIIHADGLIISGRSGEGLLGGRMAGARTLVEAFETVRKDRRVKAVVFRIDSPGGSALASEQIYQAVRKCAAAKPVVVSISSMGASGGYYVASGGTTIMADAAGVVGSIGVIGGKLSLTGLMDKIGLSTYEMTRGRNAGLHLSRPWDQREEGLVQALAQRTYDLFVQRVKESRRDKIKDIDQVAQGRIFTARQAARNGLIDAVGGIKDAVAAAQKAGGIGQTYYIITLPRPRTLSDLLAGPDDDEALSSDVLSGPHGFSLDEALLRRIAGSARSWGAASYMVNLAALLGRESVLTALPYHLSIRH